jgi:predicted nucleic acid-binding protein
MALYVFDACALIALTDKEEGADILASFLASNENTCFVHSLNLCEAYYHAHRSTSRQDAVALVEGFLDLGLVLRDDMDVEFWQEAGDLKAIHKKVSLADCCAIVLANRLNAELVTSDHHELYTLADQGISKILFFR